MTNFNRPGFSCKKKEGKVEIQNECWNFTQKEWTRWKHCSQEEKLARKLYHPQQRLCYLFLAVGPGGSMEILWFPLNSRTVFHGTYARLCASSLLCRGTEFSTADLAWPSRAPLLQWELLPSLISILFLVHEKSFFPLSLNINFLGHVGG